MGTAYNGLIGTGGGFLAEVFFAEVRVGIEFPFIQGSGVFQVMKQSAIADCLPIWRGRPGHSEHVSRFGDIQKVNPSSGPHSITVSWLRWLFPALPEPPRHRSNVF